MNQRLTGSRLSNLAAHAIYEAFDIFQTRFQEITHRAKNRFETRDWHGFQADAAERLELYREVVGGITGNIRKLLDDRLEDKLVWAGLKAVYSGLITGRNDWELGETFFNSITRRIFTTVGVDPQIEFVDTDFETPPTKSHQSVYRSYRGAGGTITLVEQILSDCRFATPYQDLHRDARLAASQIEAHLRKISALRVVDRAEIVRSVFYRGQSAYIVGRMFSASQDFPFVLALMNSPQGIFVDAVLLDENEVSVLFSYTRSYFHVDVERYYDLVRFLKNVIPRKRIAELYISVGHNKHGKTELYRDLLDHLAHSDDQFVIAPGQKGMVMVVFTIPGYDVVFKLIKDRFTYPKKGNRDTVIEKYRMVFRHDRAGRLIDAQEFEYLEFDRARFSDELVAELLKEASQTVVVQDDSVVIKHAYLERRVIPLDIYAQAADLEAARAAVIDYGNAIKDLAATNIFPGDMLLKNFGVTRHGRVVFYDYDELCLITDCNFRTTPKAPSFEEEFSAEPWFVIAENDIFPSEFRYFLGLGGELLEEFEAVHGDIFGVDFWRGLQERIAAGEIVHIFPYPQRKRLKAVDG